MVALSILTHSNIQQEGCIEGCSWYNLNWKTTGGIKCEKWHILPGLYIFYCLDKESAIRKPKIITFPKTGSQIFFVDFVISTTKRKIDIWFTIHITCTKRCKTHHSGLCSMMNTFTTHTFHNGSILLLVKLLQRGFQLNWGKFLSCQIHQSGVGGYFCYRVPLLQAFILTLFLLVIQSPRWKQSTWSSH